MPIIRKGEGKLDVQNYETGIYFIEITDICWHRGEKGDNKLILSLST